MWSQYTLEVAACPTKSYFMVIMDINDVDTQEIMERISRHCPEAMMTYIHCINRMDAGHRMFL